MPYKITSVTTEDMLRDEFSLAGNLIDNAWFKHISRGESGSQRPHFQAIFILGQIVYMYRPIKVNESDQVSQKVTTVKAAQKFEADLWQCSRSELANQFSMSLKEVDLALKTLVNSGIIYKELRNLTVRGRRLSNVLYIGLNYTRLKEISTPIALRVKSSIPENAEVLPPQATPPPQEGKTYTETPPEASSYNSPYIKTNISNRVSKDVEINNEALQPSFPDKSLKGTKCKVTKKVKGELDYLVLPDWVPKDHWQGFVDMRKELKAPLTQYSANLIIEDLSKLKAEGNDPGEVLKNSIVSSYRKVFPVRSGNAQLKDESKGHSSQSGVIDSLTQNFLSRFQNIDLDKLDFK